MQITTDDEQATGTDVGMGTLCQYSGTDTMADIHLDCVPKIHKRNFCQWSVTALTLLCGQLLTVRVSRAIQGIQTVVEHVN